MKDKIINGSSPESLTTKHKERISSIIDKIEETGVKFNQDNFTSIIEIGRSKLDIVDMELSSYISKNGFNDINEEYKNNLFTNIKFQDQGKNKAFENIKRELGMNLSIGERAAEVQEKILSEGFKFNEDNFRSVIESSTMEQDVKLKELNMSEINELILESKDLTKFDLKKDNKAIFYNKIK